MLKITLTHPTTQETATFDLISESKEMFAKIQEFGVEQSMYSLRLKDMREDGGPIRVHSDSDIGNALLKIIDDEESLFSVRTMDGELALIRDELKEDVEQNLFYEQYHSIDHLYRDIKQMLKGLAINKIAFYCPLTGNLNDHDGDYSETFGYTINCNAYRIEEALEAYQARDICMAQYIGLHSGLKDKLAFVEWNVEEVRGTLYGRIDCHISEELTPEEIESLRDAVRGQNSDGFGEGFEQREIEIDEGDLYVSFWNYHDSYFLETEDEFYDRIEQGTGMTM